MPRSIAMAAAKPIPHASPCVCSNGDGLLSVAQAQDSDAYTPLMEAAAQGHLALVARLCDAGAHTGMRDKVSASAIRHASGHAADVCMQYCDRHFAATFPACCLKALHLAICLPEHVGKVPSVDNGHDIQLELQAGKTAADMAGERGHADVAEYLSTRSEALQGTVQRPAHLRGSAAPPATPSASPSAPPWEGPATPYQAAMSQSMHPQVSSSSGSYAPPPQRSRSASSRASASDAGPEAISYPALYSASSQRSAGLIHTETESGTSTPHAAQPQATEDRRSGAADGLQAAAVQAEAAQLGYVPAALSFMLAKLQVGACCHSNQLQSHVQDT